jgi:hypothetical protein
MSFGFIMLSMKTATNKLSKAAAVEAIAEILMQLGGRVNLEEVTSAAEAEVEYLRAVAYEAKNWPLAQ